MFWAIAFGKKYQQANKIHLQEFIILQAFAVQEQRVA
jgi:hypothetical protein